MQRYSFVARRLTPLDKCCTPQIQMDNNILQDTCDTSWNLRDNNNRQDTNYKTSVCAPTETGIAPPDMSST